ncbi:MAG: CvpA family protein [Kiloniellaceae bacterium]
MENLPVNVTDAAIGMVIVVSGLFAFVRGLVHELLAIISWVGAAFATLYGFPYVQPTAREWITAPLIADMAAGVAIFLVVLIVLSVITRLLCRRVRDSSLGPLDRSLGLLFGLLRGAVLVCIAWLLLVWVLPREDHPGWIAEARSLPLVEQGGAALAALLPERLRGAPATASGGRGKASSDSYKSLLSPITKGDAPGDKPGYREPERDAMQRLIEAATQRDAKGPDK